MSVLLLLFWELVLSALCMCKNVNFQCPTVPFLTCFHDVNGVLHTLFMSYSHFVPHKKEMCLCYKDLGLINLLCIHFVGKLEKCLPLGCTYSNRCVVMG